MDISSLVKCLFLTGFDSNMSSALKALLLYFELHKSQYDVRKYSKFNSPCPICPIDVHLTATIRYQPIFLERLHHLLLPLHCLTLRRNVLKYPFKIWMCGKLSQRKHNKKKKIQRVMWMAVIVPSMEALRSEPFFLLTLFSFKKLNSFSMLLVA